jgi:hypothetical protein
MVMSGRVLGAGGIRTAARSIAAAATAIAVVVLALVACGGEQGETT